MFKSIDAVNNAINRGVRRALALSAGVVLRDAKTNCPVDTGNLRAGITTELGKNYAEVFAVAVYAPWVEYGTGLYAVNGDGRKTPWRYQTADGVWHVTHGQKPQPYMIPALDSNQEKIMEIFAKEIGAEVK